jgi:branched-chain amino acid aminotransferase
MDTLTYWNGAWQEGNPAVLGPRDHAFWLGSIIFDGGRSFGRRAPDLDQHAARAVRSARALGLNPSQTPEQILGLMREGIMRFPADAELYVRPMFWATKGGAGPISVDAESCQFLLCIYVSPMPKGPGLKLGLCHSIRRPRVRRPTPRRRACIPTRRAGWPRCWGAGSRTGSCWMRWAMSPRPAVPTCSWGLAGGW